MLFLNLPVTSWDYSGFGTKLSPFFGFAKSFQIQNQLSINPNAQIRCSSCYAQIVYAFFLCVFKLLNIFNRNKMSDMQLQIIRNPLLLFSNKIAEIEMIVACPIEIVKFVSFLVKAKIP
jgi:hypothetical protein